jgi:hypothetical protein
MKKIMVAATLATLSFAANAEGWKFGPLFTDSSFKLAPSLALTVNNVDPKDSNSETGVGVDFNFNCGLIQDPQNRMRTHINIGHTTENESTVNSFELSPRYMVPVGQNLSIGAGPSLAVYNLKAPGGYDETLFGIGVAAGVNYRSGAFFMGGDVRYHNTEKEKGTEFDNWTVGLKAGVNF